MRNNLNVFSYTINSGKRALNFHLEECFMVHISKKAAGKSAIHLQSQVLEDSFISKKALKVDA